MFASPLHGVHAGRVVATESATELGVRPAEADARERDGNHSRSGDRPRAAARTELSRVYPEELRCLSVKRPHDLGAGQAVRVLDRCAVLRDGASAPGSRKISLILRFNRKKKVFTRSIEVPCSLAI